MPQEPLHGRPTWAPVTPPGRPAKGQGAWSLYCHYIGISWRSQIAYRTSFLLQCCGTALVTVGEFLAMTALFSRFGSIAGWRLAEVAIFYGTVNLAWAVAEALARGFDDFGAIVKSGDFDRVLLRPRSTVLQILGREFTLRRIGRFAQGFIVLVWGWQQLALGTQWPQLLLLGLAVIGGVTLFVGLLIFQAALAFRTIESLEVMNVFTYGGVATAQYPLSIYPDWLRWVFTFVVPLGAFAFFPIATLLGRAEALGWAPIWGWCAPILGPVFLGLSLIAWRNGIKHYTSTGS